MCQIFPHTILKPFQVLYATSLFVYDTLYLLRRHCFLKYITEGKMEGRIEVTGRRGRKSKQLLGNLKVKKGSLKLKEETLDRTLWKTRFGRGYCPVVSQTTE